MSQNEPYVGKCIEDHPFVAMARIVGTAATAITQSSLTAIAYRVDRYSSKDDAFNRIGGTEVVDDTSLTVSSVIFNTLQTDNDWGADSTGYNFKATIPASAFPTSHNASNQVQWYVVEVWCDPTSGDDFLGAEFILECRATGRA